MAGGVSWRPSQDCKQQSRAASAFQPAQNLESTCDSSLMTHSFSGDAADELGSGVSLEWLTADGPLHEVVLNSAAPTFKRQLCPTAFRN